MKISKEILFKYKKKEIGNKLFKEVINDEKNKYYIILFNNDYDSSILHFIMES